MVDILNRCPITTCRQHCLQETLRVRIKLGRKGITKILLSIILTTLIYTSHQRISAFSPTTRNNNISSSRQQRLQRRLDQQKRCSKKRILLLLLHESNNNDDNNNWGTSITNENIEDDWQKVLLSKQDGTFWSSFEPSIVNDDDTLDSPSDTAITGTNTDKNNVIDDDMAAEMWLDQLQSLASVEVEFNLQEADRADKVRQMEEWGFDREIIKNALGVAIDNSLEMIDEVKGMQIYREESFWDSVDLTTVESHTQVEKDEETMEPTRLQMVYVDEHTCIGCTNCAMIAQSTFFMHPEHGRARVFQQWGDTDETIQIAIETCPVDCIHYVPYDELVSLEIDRRNQNINFKARLVSQAENGNTLSHLSGRGSNSFTAPQQISGNMKPRCNNCPSRGCSNCPMYGVGKNPIYEAAEKKRKEKKFKRRLQQQRERDQKSVDL